MSEHLTHTMQSTSVAPKASRVAARLNELKTFLVTTNQQGATTEELIALFGAGTSNRCANTATVISNAIRKGQLQYIGEATYAGSTTMYKVVGLPGWPKLASYTPPTYTKNATDKAGRVFVDGTLALIAKKWPNTTPEERLHKLHQRFIEAIAGI